MLSISRIPRKEICSLHWHDKKNSPLVTQKHGIIKKQGHMVAFWMRVKKIIILEEKAHESTTLAQLH